MVYYVIVFTVTIAVLLASTATGRQTQQIVPPPSNRKCDLGSFDNGVYCQPCRRGYYSDEKNAVRCKACPPGHTSEQESTSETDCEPCLIGTYAAKKGASRCIPCPPNTYVQYFRATACKKCPPGWNAGTGSNACRQCPAGFFVNDDGFCTRCPLGTATRDVSSFGIDKCIPCAKGEYRSYVVDQCTPCLPGTYANTTGQIRCKKCRPGTFANAEGAHTCTRCPKGSNSKRKPGATFCTSNNGCDKQMPGCLQCAPGTGALDSNCVKCPRGTFNNGTIATPCVECQAPRIATGSRTACVCAPPAHNPFDLGQCLNCPKGAESTDGKNCKCKNGKEFRSVRFGFKICACPPGKIDDGNGTCRPCNAQEKSGEIPGCQFCELGLAVDAKSGTCQYCIGSEVARRYTADGCDKCPADAFPTGTNCRCKDGYWRDPSQNGKCAICPPGTWQFSAGARCRPCQFNEYQDQAGKTRCKECKKGTKPSEDRRSCVIQPNQECLKGQFYNRDTNRCQCTRGLVMMKTEEGAKCKKCASGLVANDDSTQCVCPSGSVDKQGECIDCKAGTYSLLGFAECKPCPPLTYGENAGQSYCTECRKFRTDQYLVGSTLCVRARCEAGYFPKDGKGKCVRCKAGYRMQDYKCIRCGANQVSLGGSRSYCVKCTGGRKPSSDKKTCV